MEDINKDYEELLKKAMEMPGIADLMELSEELQEEGVILAQLQLQFEDCFIASTSNRSLF